MSTQDIAREAARKISNHWRSGQFRQDGGVVEGITPIIQEAIDAGFEECRFLWKHEEGKLHEQLKDAQDEAFDAYAEGDALREQIKQHKAEYDRLSGIIEIDTLRIVELEEQLSAERILSKWLPKGTDKLLKAVKSASDFMDYLRANTGVSDEWPIEFKVAPDAVDQVNKLLNDFESKIYAITKPK